MASACVNNSPALSSSSYGWPSPRISFSHDDGSPSDPSASGNPDPKKPSSDSGPNPVLEGSAKDLADFEFRLHDPVAMLPADELFSDGKLVPLQMTAARLVAPEIESAPDPMSSRISGSDPVVLSPRAPKCSSRWRDMLGLKKAQNPKPELQKSTPKSPNPNLKSLKNFLHRNPRSTPIDSSLSLPLLRDSDSESVSISSSRLSLSSSSSSGPDHEEVPRLSLDSEKPNPVPIRVVLNRTGNPNRVRVARPARRPAPGAEAESPRMNSSGKVVFNGGSLERSSSSPGSFNGGSRVRPRGMERSYSANVVRVSPVLNVPVCSLRGSGKPGSVFGFFSGQKKEKDGRSNNGSKIKSEKSSRD